jgi:GNAT superfamily N-acetyltransferase
MTDIRLGSDADRDDILRILERSDSTDRTAATWDGNPMRAVLAFDGDALIGVLPLEARRLETGLGDPVPVLWVTGAHVDPDYRSQGIGRRLDTFAANAFASNFDAVCVFREDETSRAYAWYRTCGFHPLTPIVAYKLVLSAQASEPNAAAAPDLNARVLQSRDDLRQAGPALRACFYEHAGGYGGFRERTADFWRQVVDAHYYRDLYRYSVLALFDGDRVVAYALAGQTDMRDGVPRFDLLELVAPATGPVFERLHGFLISTALACGLRELRLQFTGDDERISFFESIGYVTRNRPTNILGKLLAPARMLSRRPPADSRGWQWRAPGYGEVVTAEAGGRVIAESTDAALAGYCFGRLGAVGAVATGGMSRVALPLEVDDRVLPWRYFQVDYA